MVDLDLDIDAPARDVLAYMRAKTSPVDHRFTLTEIAAALESSHGYRRMEVVYALAHCQTRGLISRGPRVSGEEPWFRPARVI
jgi:hypothetical protein